MTSLHIIDNDLSIDVIIRIAIGYLRAPHPRHLGSIFTDEIANVGDISPLLEQMLAAPVVIHPVGRLVKPGLGAKPCVHAGYPAVIWLLNI